MVTPRTTNFFFGTRAARAAHALRGDNADPLVDHMLNLTRAQIQGHADALNLPQIPSGLLDQMLSHAKHRLAQLEPGLLARIAAGNPLLADIASESFRSVV